MNYDKYSRVISFKGEKTMKYILEENEMYNSIVKEFQISNSVLEQMKEAIYKLARARMDLWKLLKIQMINTENIDEYLSVNENEIIISIKANEDNIKDNELKQIEFIEKIKVLKQKAKVIKLQINELEATIKQEQQESRRLRENLRIFISREKFKTIKKIILRKYRKVFLKYSNELSIENKIFECNKRKEKIREEEENLNNIIKGYAKKITTDKKAMAEARKNIVSMEKSIELSYIKLKGIKNYKEIENKFRLQGEQ